MRWNFKKKKNFFSGIAYSKNPSKKQPKGFTEVISGFNSYCLGFHTDADGVANILMKGTPKYWYCIEKKSEKSYLDFIGKYIPC